MSSEFTPLLPNAPSNDNIDIKINEVKNQLPSDINPLKIHHPSQATTSDYPNYETDFTDLNKVPATSYTIRPYKPSEPISGISDTYIIERESKANYLPPITDMVNPDIISKVNIH